MFDLWTHLPETTRIETINDILATLPEYEI